jgi:hypothetical protein
MLNKIAGAVLVTLMVGGCAETIPPIVMQTKDPKTGIWRPFAEYVPKVYPIGSEARLLESTLQAQDFVLTNNTPSHFSAEYRYHWCRGGYIVKWNSDKAGRIAEI